MPDLEGILGPPHAIGQAVRPVSRGWPAAPGEFRTRAGDQPAPPRPARPRFPARGPARRDGPGAPERSGAGARGSRRPARAMIPERLCVSGGEPAPRRSRERRRVFRRPDEGGRDASRDDTPARAVAPACHDERPPAHGRVRHAINAACVRVAGTDPGPSRSRKAAVTSSAGPDGGPRRRTPAERTGADAGGPDHRRRDRETDGATRRRDRARRRPGTARRDRPGGHRVAPDRRRVRARGVPGRGEAGRLSRGGLPPLGQRDQPRRRRPFGARQRGLPRGRAAGRAWPRRGSRAPSARPPTGRRRAGRRRRAGVRLLGQARRGPQRDRAPGGRPGLDGRPRAAVERGRGRPRSARTRGSPARPSSRCPASWTARRSSPSPRLRRRADGGARHGRRLRGPRRAGPRRRPPAARARDDHHPRDRPGEAARLRRQGPRLGRQGPGGGVARGLGRPRQPRPRGRADRGAGRPPHARGAAAGGGGGRRLRARGRARPRAGAEGRLRGVGARAQGRRPSAATCCAR